jgi:hypothetical protein
MKILINEHQYKLITEQKTLSSVLNDVKFISSLITVVRVITRGVESSDLDRVQSLVKQSLSGGKVNLTKEDMAIIRKNQKIILNNVAENMGFRNWTQLKNNKLR